jgi:protein arginine N-methyltransferase 7
MTDDVANDDSIVADALRRACYNETVHVTVHRDNDDDDPTTMICLVPCLDRSTGGLRFENLLNGNDNQQILAVARRELRTKSRWFFPMLHDEHRNTLYQRAITSACKTLALNRKKNQNDTKIDRPIRILDIGSGTGLLAMMAADACHSLGVKCHITSIEMSSGFAHLARRTIADNHMEHTIQVIEGHSTQISSFQQEEWFDLCVSELLEDGLLAEGWLPTIRDAWNRHLSPDTAIVLPQRAKIYAQLGQLVLDDDDFGELDDMIPYNDDDDDDESNKLPSTFALPMPVNKLIRDGMLLLISDPVEVWECSVAQHSDIPSPEGRSTERTIVPLHNNSASITNAKSSVYGVLVWWQLEIDNENIYSTRPSCEMQMFQDHWHPVLHIFTNQTSASTAVLNSKSVSLNFFHNDYKLWVDVVATDDEETNVAEMNKRHKAVDDMMTSPSMILSSERILQLNDRKRLDVYRKSICSVLKTTSTQDILVIDVSDFSLGATLAIELGARHVVSLESSTRTGSALAELSGRAMAKACRTSNNSQAIPEVLRCRAEQLTLNNLIPEKSAKLTNSTVVVLAEPYYEQLEGWPLEEALNLYYIIRCLWGNGVLSDSSIILPFSCTIRGCIIESQQLKAAYSRLGDSILNDSEVCGFDHAYVNQVSGNLSSFDLSIPMFQYDYKILSEVLDLGYLDYSNPTEIIADSFCRGQFLHAGRCDALLVWTEYRYSSSFENNPSPLIFSCNRKFYRQQIRMLEDSVVVSDSKIHEGYYEIVCKSKYENISEIEDHLFEISITTKHGVKFG